MSQSGPHTDSAGFPTDSPSSGSSARVAWVCFLVPMGMVVVFFFAAAQYAWTLGWLYAGVLAANVVFFILCGAVWNPIMLARRAKGGPNTKSWDAFVLVLIVVCMVAACCVANADRQNRDASTDLPGLSWLAAAAVFAFGWGVMTWCGVVNPFLEKTVRIQTENNHRVVQCGPYAWVRHPFYVGNIAVMLATPIMIDSILTQIPIVACVILLIIRTSLEDKTLRLELPGYEEYARRVRFRIIPGVW